MVTTASLYSFFRWWPEIPVILAIILATALMGTLCYHFSTNEKRKNQYASSGVRRSMKVFKQSCLFVIAFYITWVPYITLQACEAQYSYCIYSYSLFWSFIVVLVSSQLQYMLSTGKGYDNFRLILSAATLVPLQGFWKTFVYIRVRSLSNIIAHAASFICRISSFD